ncbi:MAG: type 1 glutamine amidotransferase, partial [Leptospiraceae bacterium]|nr:type 1 glutamine amidotransferase [Leptospiraceae bacterium]
NYKALVVLGGPDSANDDTGKMKIELSRIRDVIANKIPYLGICLGLQTLVKAAGGKILKSPVREIGFLDPEGKPFTVELTDTGKKDPLFEGLNHSFHVFHLHGETVELSSDMSLLAKGKFCQNQIAKVGERAYGIQCHFELTKEMFEVWIDEDTDLLSLNTEELRKHFQSIHEEYERVGKQLFKNFLKLSGFIE